MALGGCATYHPIPLTSEAVARRLAPPDMQQVRVRAETITHPILKPIPFDERDGLSPDEAAILAVIANPTLRAVRDRRRIAAAQLLQAGILPNPQLSYNVDTPVSGDTQGKVTALGLGLDWDITSLITRDARIEGARAHVASVDLEVAWQEWQVAEAAKLHVYRRVIAQKRLALARRVETVYRQSYILIQRGIDLGEKTALDMSTINAAWYDAKLAVLAAQGEAERERLALNRALGLPSGKVVPLQRNIGVPSARAVPSAQVLGNGVEQRRLDILALRLAYESQEARVRAAVRSQFPKISIGVSGARDTDRFQTAGVGLTIDFPFFDRNQGRIAIERATRKQLFDEYVARLFEARADVARITKGLRATSKQIASIEASMSPGIHLVEAYHKAAHEGRVSILRYYNTLNSVYARQLERINLEKRLVGLVISLEIASGRYFPCAAGLNPAGSTRREGKGVSK
ncbi:MAG: TolC family protein [Candidatus Methylomirabilales bacterium]